jgi:hypothetical protein
MPACAPRPATTIAATSNRIRGGMPTLSTGSFGDGPLRWIVTVANGSRSPNVMVVNRLAGQASGWAAVPGSRCN